MTMTFLFLICLAGVGFLIHVLIAFWKEDHARAGHLVHIESHSGPSEIRVERLPRVQKLHFIRRRRQALHDQLSAEPAQEASDVGIFYR